MYIYMIKEIFIGHCCNSEMNNVYLSLRMCETKDKQELEAE